MQSTELSKSDRAEPRGTDDAGTTAPDLNRLCFIAIYRHHRPVQGCRTATCPGRRLALVMSEATVILPQKMGRSTPLLKIFRGQYLAVAPRAY
jgi:hypothetical protein